MQSQIITDGFNAYQEPPQQTQAISSLGNELSLQQQLSGWSPVTVQDDTLSVSMSGSELRSVTSRAEATTISTLPSDVITINGVSATKQAFIVAGILNEDGSQKAEETPSDATASGDSQGSQGSQGSTNPHALPSDAVEALNYAFEDIPDSSLNAVTSMGIAASVGNGDVSGIVDEIVRITGEHPGFAQERIEQAQAIFQAQADKALSDVGIKDLGHFYSFAKTSHKGELVDAVNRQVYGSDLSGYIPIVKAYMLKASGYGAKAL